MEASPTTQRHILIIEDEKPMAMALQLKFRKIGYVAEVAFDGEAALALLKTQKFDVVLTDLMMPKVDGFAVLQALKEQGNPVPVLVLSNLSQAEDERRARDLGAKDFFVKSNTTIAAIVEAVQNFLH
ncbi:MAG: two-component system, OmpR family, response regulator [Patescibacteria group bacterium]|jgi:DNA-binding response OmpR family regulator|nr:two-component system, OmpR family, response regulator [Patescibacteria group bacterium]